MNQFLEGFLRDAPGKLSEIRREALLAREQNLSDQARTRHHLRRIFQQIHTLKGSAAAFGIELIRALAHEVENLLDNLRSGEIVCDEAAFNALDSGIEKIEVAFIAVQENKSADLPPESNLKIRGLQRNIGKKTAFSSENLLPAEFLEKLTEKEKEHLQQIVASGIGIFVLAVEFPVKDFQTQLRNLRSRLQQEGEIVATLPAAPAACATPAKIALQIVCAAQFEPSDILESISSLNGKILFANKSLFQIAEAAATALFAGRRAAAELGKEIDFELVGGKLKIPQKQVSALTTALLHLVTNAVAHGIEAPDERLLKQKQRGTIRITAELIDNSIRVCVKDDGRGIDFEKITQTAERVLGIIPDSAKFDHAEARNLIFTPGFSTAETLTQVAGRGVGLDAAKSAIETIGGTIEVKSKLGKGTTFEIWLPQK